MGVSTREGRRVEGCSASGTSTSSSGFTFVKFYRENTKLVKRLDVRKFSIQCALSVDFR